jgi:hypothetical protein
MSLSKQMGSNSSTLLQIYSLSVEIMALARSFDCIMDVSCLHLAYRVTAQNHTKLMVTTLRNIISTDTIMSVVDHLHRYANIWQCMGSLGTLVVELDTAQQALKVRGHQSRLPFDLLELDGGRYLTPTSRDRINSEIVYFTLVSCSSFAMNHNLRLARHFVPSPLIQNAFLMSCPTFFGLKNTLTLISLRAWRIAFGLNIAHLLNGVGKCGIMY